MKPAIFGFIAGVVVAVSGTSFTQEPLKASALIAVLCAAFGLLRSES